MPEVRGECPNCKEEYNLQVPDAVTKRLFSCPTCSHDLTGEDGLPQGWQEFTRNPKKKEPEAVIEVKKKRDFKDPGKAMEAGVEAAEDWAKTVKEQASLSHVSIAVNVRGLGSLNVTQTCQPEERMETAKELVEFGIKFDKWVSERIPPPKMPEFSGMVRGSYPEPSKPCENPDCGCDHIESHQAVGPVPSQLFQPTLETPLEAQSEVRVADEDMKVIREHDAKMDRVLQELQKFQEPKARESGNAGKKTGASDQDNPRSDRT
jgi:hypothetical protein